MPLTSGELTNKLRSRMVFADFTRQKDAAQLGLRTPLRIQSFNGGVNPASAYQQAVEGAAYTTRAEELSYIRTVIPDVPVDPVIVPPASAQWATSIGSSADDQAYSIAVDSSGNVYVSGFFKGTATIKNFSSAGGTGGAITLTPYGTLTYSGAFGIAFIVKYNSSGTAQWATTISSSSSDITNPSIAVDNNGNVYVTGTFQVSATIRSFSSAGGSGGPITLTSYGTLTSAGFTDVFIVKYNTSGIAQWANSIGSADNDQGYSIAFDTSGNVYVTGSYGANATIRSFVSGGGGGAITLTSFGTLTSASSSGDAFIVKYNSSGVAQWATSIESIQPDIGFSIAVDNSSNVYVCVYFSEQPITIKSYSTVTAGTIILTSYGTITPNVDKTDNISVIKYSSSGIVQWATDIETFSNSTNAAVAVDNLGNVYITALFNNSAIINNFTSGSGGGAITLTPYGTITTVGDNSYIVKYNSSGIAQWATCIGSATTDSGRCIAVDNSGNVYLTGYFSSTVTIKNFSNVGGGSITLTSYGTLAPAGSFDAFIVKYNTSGSAQWATTIGSTGQDFGLSIAVDNAGNVCVAGVFTGTATIKNASSGGGGGPITLTSYGTLQSSGSRDAFIVKYDQT